MKSTYIYTALSKTAVQLLSFCLLLVLSLSGHVHAQSAKAKAGTYVKKYEPLKIGDSLPQELWDLPLQVTNHPQGRQTITLNDYREKVIILDFWATWCGPCLDNFPKVDSLNRAMSDKAAFVLVNSIKGTGDKKDKIEFLLKNRTNPSGKKYSMPSVVEDIILKEFFPFRSVPHYVWIAPNGTYLGATESEEVKRSKIDQAYTNRLETKGITVYREIDSKEKILSDLDDLDIKPKKLLGTITRKKPEFGTIGGGTSDNGVYKKYWNSNIPLIFHIKNVIQFVNEGFINDNQIYVNGEKLKNAKVPLLTDSVFCYEFIAKEGLSAGEFLKTVLADLGSFSGYNITYPIKEIDTWVVTVSDSTKIKKGEGKGADNNILDAGLVPKYIINQKINTLVNVLNERSDIPLLNETGINYNINLDLPGNPLDMVLLDKVLRKQGFQINKEKRKWKVLEFKSK